MRSMGNDIKEVLRRQNVPNTVNPIDYSKLPKLPINNQVELNDVEQQLLDDSVKDLLVRYYFIL